MPPNANETPTGVLSEEDDMVHTDMHSNTKLEPREYKLVWRNIILYIYLLMASVYGLYLVLTSANWKTTLTAIVFINLGSLGITGGAHRLWSHRSYKAKFPLKLLMVILQSISFQGSIIEWARDHRVHHKYSETDADPHNARRGMFFAHVGWLLTRRHPDVITKGKRLDLSDLYNDPLVSFQHKYYLIVMPFFCFFVPIFIPMYFWGEGFINASCINLLRYCLGLNITWLVNSAAHMVGDRPYDKFISPSENKTVAILALGEGWHNYHHTFPWDYKTSEFGASRLNPTAAFIDLMAKFGLAYDLKSVTDEMIQKRTQRTGDGSHEKW